jgi:hypothetical protein
VAFKKSHLDQASLRLVLENLGKAQVDLNLALKAGVKAGGDRWYQIAQESIGQADHDLSDLAVMDHPYARRHGHIEVHEGWSLHMKDTTNLVHVQSGRMLQALHAKFEPEGAGGPTYTVQLNPDEAPEVAFVLKGTDRMLPRDPLMSAALAPQTQEDIRAAIVSRVQRRFGSSVGLKFS